MRHRGLYAGWNRWKELYRGAARKARGQQRLDALVERAAAAIGLVRQMGALRRWRLHRLGV